MQRLESRHWLAVGIVGVQAEAEIRVGEVLRLRHRAHIEGRAVVGLQHAPDEGHGFEDRPLTGRHLADECEPVLQQPCEPAETPRRARAQLARSRPGEVGTGV